MNLEPNPAMAERLRLASSDALEEQRAREEAMKQRHRELGLCLVHTHEGGLCENPAPNGTCSWHANPRCKGYTSSGRRCLNRATKGTGYCSQHDAPPRWP
jgi:hypothetical protein